MTTNRRHGMRLMAMPLGVCLTLAALLLAGCDRSVMYHETKHIADEGWHMDDALVYNLEAKDTTTTYVCFIDMRNLNAYPYSNIYFNVQTIYPDGAVAADTNLEFTLAAPDGRWLGKTSGKYVDGRYPMCYFHFPQEGKYQFVIRHAMRDTVLRGVKDVALHVERP